MTIFVNKRTGEPLRDPAVHQRIVDAIKVEGADAWFKTDGAAFLGADYNVNDYEKINDILDVWFDSGCTHSFDPMPMLCIRIRNDVGSHRGSGRLACPSNATAGFSRAKRVLKTISSLMRNIRPMGASK
jgi:hypothetical protein